MDIKQKTTNENSKQTHRHRQHNDDYQRKGAG